MLDSRPKSQSCQLTLADLGNHPNKLKQIRNNPKPVLASECKARYGDEYLCNTIQAQLRKKGKTLLTVLST